VTNFTPRLLDSPRLLEQGTEFREQRTELDRLVATLADSQPQSRGVDGRPPSNIYSTEECRSAKTDEIEA
jgi:hypothetical protein